MSTTTIPRRISVIQWMRAELANITFGADHKGAGVDWHPIVEFGDEPATARGVAPIPSADPTEFIPPVRRPIAAIAATAEYQVDELGPWKPEEHEMQPARLAVALTLTGAWPRLIEQRRAAA